MESESKFYLGKKCLGVHWPTKVYKNTFKHLAVDEKPKVKKTFTYDGIKGMLLSKKVPHDNPLCTKVYECTKHKLGHKKTLVKGKDLKHRSHMKPLFQKMLQNKAIRIGKPTKAFDHEEA